MSVEGLLARARVSAESLMGDACVIRRNPEPGEAGEFNWSTHEYSGGQAQTIYEGRCRVQSPAPDDPETVEHAGREAVLENSVLQLPWTADCEVGDEVEISAVSAVSDPSLVGQVFTVARVQRKSHATCRRLLIERKG